MGADACHLMVVLSNALPGREDDYNDWYSRVHIHDTINKLDGFASGRRFQLADLADAPAMPYRYLAIYEVPEDKLDVAYQQFRWSRGQRAEALAEGREPLVPVSDAIDLDHFLVGFYSPMGDRISSERTSL